MDLITKTLHHIGQNLPNTIAVQIGAMDGIMFDDTRGFFDMYKWKSILIEPIPHIFEELKENLKDRENLIFEQCAITNFDGEVEMLTIPKDVIEKEDLHPGYKGMSALYPLKNGFGSDYQRDIDVKTQFTVNIMVPSMTMDSLLIKHNISDFDILICDAEGYDWEIFKQLDLVVVRPKFIRLEYCNLTQEEKDLLIDKLNNNNYQFEISGQNIDAVDKTYLTFDEDKINSEYVEKLSLNDIIVKYGSDKVLSGYANRYSVIFNDLRDKEINLLEVGLGTLKPEYESTFIGITGHYDYYQPAGCLRAWKEYFKNGKIYGIDIADDCMISEDRIETFLFSSLEKNSCDENLKDLTFDIIIDDGLHTSDGQYNTFKNLFHRVKENGYYIIEDISGSAQHSNVMVDYQDFMFEEINKHEYFYLTNQFLIIRKNYSNNGRKNDFNSFTNGKKIIEKKYINEMEYNQNMTIVTGLWNIGRNGRPFDHYIENFKRFLDIPQNLFIYIPKEYEYLVWEKRTPQNTYVKIYELEDVKNLYAPFWDKTQEIRTSPDWLNLAGWLSESPQASLEWYNPIVQSKMFMLNDASIWNPFETEYFFWLDAGITNTVPYTHLVENNALNTLTDYSNPFLFLSYSYEAHNEIHGFRYDKMNEFARNKVDYVCRGGLFGGHKQQLNEANSTYYSVLSRTLNEGYMGTEESIFTIMSYNEPHLYKRFELDSNGLIVKFTQALIDNNVTIVEPQEKPTGNTIKYTDNDVYKYKTNLYILTFNFPEQVLHTIKSMEKTPEWLIRPHLVLIDNSTDQQAKVRNVEIANQYGFEYIDMNGNTGICGGRQKAAEHFHDSDADFMFFFEDDMTVNPPEYDGQYCRNGFRKYIPNLYNIVHKIMLKDEFDFLKLTFTEVFFDNDKQCSWYNVPQHIRTRDWPNYDRLPVQGLDPNVPLTNFNNIKNMDGVCFIDGEIYYANWPMIVSKKGNQKMFIDTKWTYPYEQTWMSHMYQMTREGSLRPAVLLAAPIWHDRIMHYKPEERREN